MKLSGILTNRIYTHINILCPSLKSKKNQRGASYSSQPLGAAGNLRHRPYFRHSPTNSALLLRSRSRMKGVTLKWFVYALFFDLFCCAACLSFWPRRPGYLAGSLIQRDGIANHLPILRCKGNGLEDEINPFWLFYVSHFYLDLKY